MKIAILQNDIKQIEAITDALDHAVHQVDVFFNRAALDSQLLNFDLIIANQVLPDLKKHQPHTQPDQEYQ